VHDHPHSHPAGAGRADGPATGPAGPGGRGIAVAERPHTDEPGGRRAAVDERPYTDEPGDGTDDTLVLDIGEDIGALILYTAEGLLGAEIEVSPDVDGAHRIHTLIRRRRIGGHELFAGVYPELREGTWRIFGLDDRVIGTVDIRGGHVTEYHGDTCRSA